MATQTYTDGVTLTAAAEFNNFDSAAYSALSGVAGTDTITATGPANYTYSATRPPVWFIPAVTNTGATTINITPSGGAALGAKNVFFNGAACVGGELIAGNVYGVSYDGTQFNIVSSIAVATQAQQETGTSVRAAVTPGRQQFHPSAAKAWVQYDSGGGLTASYNLTSVTDNSPGNLSPVWATDFSGAAYCIVANHESAHSSTSATTWTTQVLSRVAGGCNIATIRMSDFTQIDVTYVSVVAYGDQ
jgi:hypothetical protein